jgi:DNA gyrase subunit B
MTTKKDNSPKEEKQIKKDESGYSAKDIYVMKGLEAVRKRPGMYIGSTGPDGLHHLIWEVADNSITHDTPIIIREKGQIKILKIGELVTNYFSNRNELVTNSSNNNAEILRGDLGIETLTFSPVSLKLEFRPIFSLIRHRVNSEIYKVTLQNGRQVEITPYHSLFTLSNGKVLPVTGQELNIGSSVVVPKTWPETNNPITSIDLIDELLNLPAVDTQALYLYNINGLLDNSIAKILKPNLQAKAAATRSQHHSNLFYDFKRYNYLPFNYLRLLDNKTILSIKKKTVLGTRKNPRVRLSTTLTVNRALAELLGLFAAEGCLVKNKGIFSRVVFGLGSHETALIDYLKQLIQQVFGLNVAEHYVHETARTVAIDSYLIALLFRKIIATGQTSASKKVPNLIFNLEEELRKRYLIGYLAGDGYPTKTWVRHLINNTSPNKAERAKFSFATKSRELYSSLAYLLSSLQKSYSYSGVIRPNQKHLININYKGTVSTRQFNAQCLIHKTDFYWNTNSSYFNRLPFDEVIGCCLDNNVLTQRNNGQLGISSEKISTLLTQQKITLKENGLKFLTSDLGILKVKKIEKINYQHPWVYDVSVPEGENFVGGFAPVCLHNSLDEAMAGFCKNIDIVIMDGNKVSVTDDGRGIPVETHPQTGVSTLETVMTVLHAGGKFGGAAYKVSGGLHGVGVSVVCALTKHMKAEVCRDGFKYSQEYSQGNVLGKVKKIGECSKTGTTITFEPDPEIFKDASFSLKRVINHLRQQAYLTPGVKISVRDERVKPAFSYTFYFEGGLRAYVKYLIGGDETHHENSFYVKAEKEGVLVEAAFQYAKEADFLEEAFANNIHNPEGGTHLTGFRTALTRCLNDYARKNGYLKEKDENLMGNDVRENLIAAVSVKIKDPQFEGQTKAKLGNVEAKTAVESAVGEALADFLEKIPHDARSILDNCLLAARARKAAKAARATVLRKGVLDGLTLPGKLADCSSKAPEESELYLVEGDSAGGSSKMARDRRTQAILPLRGKILNVEKARLDKMLASQEVKNLIIALGTAIAQDFDITKLRYHKIILMCDADVDGSHIRTLLLTLFYRHFKEVVEKGYLYIAQPPLYKVQAGKQVQYAYTDEDKEEILSEFRKIKETKLEKTAKKSAKVEAVTAPETEAENAQEAVEEETALKDKIAGVSIQRYKGLGEMNPEQLWETTMNPENRVLLQVNIDDAKSADHIFDVLMGQEVAPRKKFIQVHAKQVKNLDV